MHGCEHKTAKWAIANAMFEDRTRWRTGTSACIMDNILEHEEEDPGVMCHYILQLASIC